MFGTKFKRRSVQNNASRERMYTDISTSVAVPFRHTWFFALRKQKGSDLFFLFQSIADESIGKQFGNTEKNTASTLRKNKILQRTEFQDIYRQKYKGIGNALQMFCQAHALQKKTRFTFLK